MQNNCIMIFVFGKKYAGVLLTFALFTDDKGAGI